MRKILLISLLGLIILIPSLAQAGLVPCGHTIDDPKTPNIDESQPCTFCDFFVMTDNILDFLLLPPDGIVFIIAVLMLVVGGVMFFFAGANPNALQTAKGIITSVVIGLVIIFCAWVIVNTVITKIGIVESPSILQWYNIECQ